jgi:hypothetical protein
MSEHQDEVRKSDLGWQTTRQPKVAKFAANNTMRVSVVGSNLAKIDEERPRKNSLEARNSPYYQQSSEVRLMDGPFSINNVVVLE